MVDSPFSSAVNANGVTTQGMKKDDILRTLEALRQNTDKRQGYMQARTYTDYLPQTLGTKPQDTSMWEQNLQGIQNQGDKALELSMVLHQNKLGRQQALRAKKQQKQQQQQLSQQQSTGGGGNSTPGPIKGFNPHAPLANYNWHGFNLRLNSSVMGRFVGFLNALSARGYKIKSIGTYANRNIAGSGGVQSLHALGLAMDINPSDNPVTYNGHNITNLPPGVGALAARYGLKWGGSWIHNKRDPMHFSVPYGGRE
jgi:hypothetical protein